MPKNKGKVSCRYYSVSLPESTPLAKVFHCHFVVSACLAALRERGHHGIENDRKILGKGWYETDLGAVLGSTGARESLKRGCGHGAG